MLLLSYGADNDGSNDAEKEEYPNEGNKICQCVADGTEDEFYGEGGYFHEAHADEGGGFVRAVQSHAEGDEEEEYADYTADVE